MEMDSQSILQAALKPEAEGGLPISDQFTGKSLFRTQINMEKDCFNGLEFSRWLQKNGFANSEPEVIQVANLMMEEGVLVEVMRSVTEFEPVYTKFYRFTCLETMRGKAGKMTEGAASQGQKAIEFSTEDISWSALNELAGKTLAEANQDQTDWAGKAKSSLPDLLLDGHTAKMLDNVRPTFWTDPLTLQEAAKQGEKAQYDLVVIGGGTAGMVTAAAAALYGAKTCLIEKNMIGGDCLVTGCIPSKTLLKSARVAKQMKSADQFGIEAVSPPKTNFSKVMDRVRELRAEVSKFDSAQRFSNAYGFDLVFGAGEFVDEKTIRVNGVDLSFIRACIATGARPRIPTDIKGLSSVKYFTSDTIFNLTEQPKRMAVLGGGAVGCELGQAFALLGSEVTILQKHADLISSQDEFAAKILEGELKNDGVRVELSANTKEVTQTESGIQIHFASGADGESQSIEVDLLLVATGRTPNVESLNLDKAGIGIEYDGAVKVNDHLQTANKVIYACGDVLLGYQSTHNAEQQARDVVMNAFFFGSHNYKQNPTPRCLFTTPEVACIGKNQRELDAEKHDYEVYHYKVSSIDRAICDSNTTGEYRIYIVPGKDTILGATFIGGPATELIGIVSVAMAQKKGLVALSECIFPYPSYGECFRRMGDAFKKQDLMKHKKLIAKVIQFRR